MSSGEAIAQKVRVIFSGQAGADIAYPKYDEAMDLIDLLKKSGEYKGIDMQPISINEDDAGPFKIFGVRYESDEDGDGEELGYMQCNGIFQDTYEYGCGRNPRVVMECIGKFGAVMLGSIPMSQEVKVS